MTARSKELLALAVSIVRDCDDCSAYHLRRLRRMGLTDTQLGEAVEILLLVGGSTLIPHLRRLLSPDRA